MPRSIDGFGLVPLESLVSGRPVVAVPTGGMEPEHRVWIA
jgi:glycosyltransferase involved in cell wall biosynthesis